MRMLVAWCVTVLCAVALGGCTDAGQDGDPAGTPTDTPTATPPPAPANATQPPPAPVVASSFAALDPGITCVSLCEPVVVTDGATIFVKGDTYARGTPEDFEAFPPPPRPSQLGPTAFQTDRHLDVDPAGRLWFSALIAASDGVVGAAFSLLGVQVARSDDGGDTWATNAYLGLASPSPHDAQGADRQWLGFGPDGTVWVSFQRNAAVYAGGFPVADRGNVLMASSVDDGATWSAFEELDDVPGSSHVSGPMYFDGNTPVVPVHRYAAPAGLFGFSPGAPPAPMTPVGQFFPMVRPFGDILLIATMDLDWTLQVSLFDGNEITLLWNGTPDAMVSSPWLGVRGTSYDVVWLERTAGTDNRFDVLWSRDGAAPTTIVSGLQGNWGPRVNTDFAHFTYLDDRLLVVAGDNDDGSLALYWENPAP